MANREEQKEYAAIVTRCPGKLVTPFPFAALAGDEYFTGQSEQEAYRQFLEENPKWAAGIAAGTHGVRLEEIK